MSETFRSKVEAIISPLLEIGYVSDELRPCVCNNAGMKCPPDTSCTKCQADRICAALKERVEGMASLKGLDYDDRDAHDWGVSCGIRKCQEYMLEGLDV